MEYLQNLNEVLSEWGSKVADTIKSNLDTTGTTASGRTRDSIEVVVENGELWIYGRPYFQSVEQGRGPGGVPYRFQDIIRKWMDDKGVSNQFGEKEWQKRNAAWLIAQKIKNEGSRLFRQGGREDIYTETIDEELPELEKELALFITQTISTAL